MESIRAKLIVPVDLNALMYKNYVCLANFLARLDRQVEAEAYTAKAEGLKAAVMAVMFEPETKTWRDYDLLNRRQRNFFYASNIFPLWTGCYPAEQAAELGRSAAAYLLDQAAITPAGLLTSTVNSGMQWDAPNCWPPLQEVAVTGRHTMYTILYVCLPSHHIPSLGRICRVLQFCFYVVFFS